MLGNPRFNNGLRAIPAVDGRGDSGCRECVVYRDCLDKLQVRFLECQSMIASVFRMPFQHHRFDQLNNNNNNNNSSGNDKLKVLHPERCNDQLYELLGSCNDTFGEQDHGNGTGLGRVWDKSTLLVDAFDSNSNSVGLAGDSQLSENVPYDAAVKENVRETGDHDSEGVGNAAESELSNQVVSEDGVWDGRSCDSVVTPGESMEESYNEQKMGSIGNDGNLIDPEVEDRNGMDSVECQLGVGARSKQDGQAEPKTQDDQLACFSSGAQSYEITHLEFLNNDVCSAEESGEQIMPGNDLLNGDEGFINQWQLGGYKKDMEFCSAAESANSQNSYPYTSPFAIDGDSALMSNHPNPFIDHNHPAGHVLDSQTPTAKKRNFARSRAVAGRQPPLKRNRLVETMLKPSSCSSGLRSSEIDSKSALEFGLTDWNEMPPVQTFPVQTAGEPQIEATNSQPRSFVDDEEPHTNSQSSNPISSFLNAMMAEKNFQKKPNMSGPFSFSKNPYFDNSLQSLGEDPFEPRYQQLCLNPGQLTNHSMSATFHPASIPGPAEEAVQTRTISTLVVRRAIRPFVPPFKDPSESRDHQIYSYHRKSDGRKYRKRCRLCWQFYRIRKDVNTFCGTCEDNPPLCAEPCFSEYHGHDFERNLLAIPSSVVPVVPQERANDAGCATTISTSPSGALQTDSLTSTPVNSGSASCGARNLTSPQHLAGAHLGEAGSAEEESQSGQESLDSKPAIATMADQPTPSGEEATAFMDADIVVKLENDSENIV